MMDEMWVQDPRRDIRRGGSLSGLKAEASTHRKTFA
jgi:hypothetical protein